VNVDQAWQAIDAQRIRLTDVLEQLSDEEWRQPSLCPGWTVRDVAAHLTLQQVGLGRGLLEVPNLIKARGNLNRLIRDSARERSVLPPEQIIAQIRGMVGSRKHNFGLTYRETLVDILVHSQDITIPLGRRLGMPADAAALAASRVWSKDMMFHAAKRLTGYRLTATDVPWSVGDGAEVQGPIASILLLLTGRLVDLPLLTGEGAAALTALLAASQG
jgi:uncharacterized protein (TIGR03083 family)